MLYTNQQVATMSIKAITEAFSLASKQNAWRYQYLARSCADGQESAPFNPPKRRDAGQSQDTAGQSPAQASPKPAKPVKAAPGPLASLDAKTAAVGQLLAVARGVSFSAATLRSILEASSQLPELAFLDAGQLAGLKKWAGCKSLEERVAEFCSKQQKAIYTVDQNRKMALSLVSQGYRVDVPEAVESILSLSYANSLVTQPGELDIATAGKVEQFNHEATYGFTVGGII